MWPAGCTDGGSGGHGFVRAPSGGHVQRLSLLLLHAQGIRLWMAALQQQLTASGCADIVY